jgi:hypothetical protein
MNAAGTEPTTDGKFVYSIGNNILEIAEDGGSSTGLLHSGDEGTPTVSFPPYAFQLDTNSGFSNRQGKPDEFAWQVGGNYFVIYGSGGGTGNQEVGSENTDIPFVPPRTEVEWQWSDALVSTDQWGKVLLVQETALQTVLDGSADVGQQVSFIFDGPSGQLQIAADTGETINGLVKVIIAERYGGVTCVKDGATTWIATGNLL